MPDLNKSDILYPMPHTKSAKKEIRKSKKRYAANLRVQRSIKAQSKEIREKAAGGDAVGARQLFPKFQKTIDKAAKKNIIKKNTAARKKSRMEAMIRRNEKPAV